MFGSCPTFCSHLPKGPMEPPSLSVYPVPVSSFGTESCGKQNNS